MRVAGHSVQWDDLTAYGAIVLELVGPGTRSSSYAHACRRDSHYALALHESIRATDVRYIGFKNIGAFPDTLQLLTDRIHHDRRAAVPEFVSETADDELRSVDFAIDVVIDLLMAGTHPEPVLPRLPRYGVRYCSSVARREATRACFT